MIFVDLIEKLCLWDLNIVYAINSQNYKAVQETPALLEDFWSTFAVLLYMLHKPLKKKTKVGSRTGDKGLENYSFQILWH